MPVEFRNFEFSYQNERGKPVFVPSERGRRIGEELKCLVEDAYDFDPIYYHFREGAHVAALHSHRSNQFFARIDIRNFFYSVARNRVKRALTDIGIGKAQYFAKWSCVKNPYETPSYALPYGFVQSPILATLTFDRSPIGEFLKQMEATSGATVTVYLDDIALSSNDPNDLKRLFEAALQKVVEANFEVHAEKTRGPAPQVELFNCQLALSRTKVSPSRIEEFHAVERSAKSVHAFERYCAHVETGNVEP